MKRWWQERHIRRYNKAAKLLKQHADRHADAGHMVEFENLDGSLLIYRCNWCPNIHL